MAAGAAGAREAVEAGSRTSLAGLARPGPSAWCLSNQSLPVPSTAEIWGPTQESRVGCLERAAASGPGLAEAAPSLPPQPWKSKT